MNDNKILKWIMETNLRRWLLFIPLSVVSSFLGSVIWKIFNRYSMGRMISTDSLLYNLYDVPISGIIFGFIFVYVGGYIAPNRHVVLFLVSIVIVFSLASLFVNIFLSKNIDYWTCLSGIFFLIGGLMGGKYLKNGGE